MLRTRLDLRTRIATDTRETQINSTIDEYLNLTLQEIQDPTWAFEQIAGMRGYTHKWSFNRRKYTLATVASTEFYQLPRDLDAIGLIRQTTSPAKIRYIPDELFYDYIPNPTATGNPKWYRMWEEEGVEARLAADDTIEVVSSSTSDTSQTVRIVGKDSNGLPQTESLTLTGQTAVSGTITWNAGDVLRVSKSASTVGTITVRRATGDTTLVKLNPTELTARFKIISFYPIPSSVISLYLEYYARIRDLEGNDDVPDIAEKWLWVVRIGTMAKVYQYQGKESLFNTTQAMYGAGVRSMVKADMSQTDYIPTLKSSLSSLGHRDILDLSDLPLGA